MGAGGKRRDDRSDFPSELEKALEPGKPVEIALLGLILKKPDLYHEINGIVENSHFTHCREIFLEMQCQMAERRYFDAVTLRDAFSKKKEYEGLDGLFDRIELESKAEIPDAELSEKAKSYAGCILEDYYRKSLANFAKISATKLENKECSVKTGAEELYMQARHVLGVFDKEHKVVPLISVLKECFVQIENIRDRRSRILGIQTGYFELDDMTSGLMKGNLYVIGGRPSMGKTSLQTCILERIILKERKPALFFSLEMSKQEIATRMMCSKARVNSNLLRSGKVSEDDYQRLIMAAGALHDANMFINDDPLSIEDIVKISHDYHKLENISVIAIDYLQKITGAYGKDSSRDQDIGYVSRELKNLAKELQIPVVVSAQLNRGAENTGDNRPRLSSLRESGQIEQEADVVILLYRDEYYNPDSCDNKNIAEAIIAKNRSGPTKTVQLAFIPEYTRFENLAAAPS